VKLSLLGHKLGEGNIRGELSGVKMFGGNLSGKGNVGGGNCPGEMWQMSEGDVGISIENYKSTFSGYDLCHPG